MIQLRQSYSLRTQMELDQKNRLADEMRRQPLQAMIDDIKSMVWPSMAFSAFMTALKSEQLQKVLDTNPKDAEWFIASAPDCLKWFQPFGWFAKGHDQILKSDFMASLVEKRPDSIYCVMQAFHMNDYGNRFITPRYLRSLFSNPTQFPWFRQDNPQHSEQMAQVIQQGILLLDEKVWNLKLYNALVDSPVMKAVPSSSAAYVVETGFLHLPSKDRTFERFKSILESKMVTGLLTEDSLRCFRTIDKLFTCLPKTERSKAYEEGIFNLAKPEQTPYTARYEIYPIYYVQGHILVGYNSPDHRPMLTEAEIASDEAFQKVQATHGVPFYSMSGFDRDSKYYRPALREARYILEAFSAAARGMVIAIRMSNKDGLDAVSADHNVAVLEKFAQNAIARRDNSYPLPFLGMSTL